MAFLAPGPAAQAQTKVSLGLRLGGNWATRAGDDPAYRLGASPTPTSSQLSYARQGIVAPQFGAVLDIQFGKLALQPAVLFSQKGVEQLLDATTTFDYSLGNPPFTRTVLTEKKHTISRANYLEIPVNMVYTLGGDHGFLVFAGPYVAMGVGGRVEYENQATSYSSSSTGGTTSYSYSYGNTFFIYRDTYPGPPATNASGIAPSYEINRSAEIARRFDAGINAGLGYRFGNLQMHAGYGLGLINQQPRKAPIFSSDPTPFYHRVAQLTGTFFFPLPKALAAGQM